MVFQQQQQQKTTTTKKTTNNNNNKNIVNKLLVQQQQMSNLNNTKCSSLGFNKGSLLIGTKQAMLILTCDNKLEHNNLFVKCLGLSKHGLLRNGGCRVSETEQQIFGLVVVVVLETEI